MRRSRVFVFKSLWLPSVVLLLFFVRIPSMELRAASQTDELLGELSRIQEALLPELQPVLETAKSLQPDPEDSIEKGQWPAHIFRIRWERSETQLVTFTASVFRWPNRVQGDLSVKVLKTTTSPLTVQVERSYTNPLRAQIYASLKKVLQHDAMGQQKRVAERAAAIGQLWITSKLTEVGVPGKARLVAVCPRHPNLELCEVTAKIEVVVRE